VVLDNADIGQGLSGEAGTEFLRSAVEHRIRMGGPCRGRIKNARLSASGQIRPFTQPSRTTASPSPADIRDDSHVVALGSMRSTADHCGGGLPSGQLGIAHRRSARQRPPRLPA